MIDYTSRQLRAFLLVAQHRSFSRAAEALFITPSGLSVVIRELETELGFRLFNRTSRHVALTDYGGELLPLAQTCLGQFDYAVARIRGSASEASRSLSVGATPLVAADVLPRTIQEFRKHHPDLRVHVFEGDHPTLIQRVQKGDLDMALGAFFETATGIRRMPFFRFSLMLIRAGEDPPLRPASTPWSAIKGEALISLPPVNPTQRLIDRHLKQAGVAFPHRIVLNYLNTAIAMVEAGEGVAIIPSFAVPACRGRRVIIRQLTNPAVYVEFFQIRNRGKKLPPGADEFTLFLKNYIARWTGRAGVL